MQRLHGVLAVAAAVLCGCAWVLPKPAAPAPTASVGSPDCTIALAESRRTRGATVYSGSAAAPLVIVRDAPAGTDRAVRSGAPIVLRPATTTEGVVSGANEGVALSIEAVAGAGAADTIRDGSVIRLRSRVTGAIAAAESGPGSTATDASVPAGVDYMIYKADRPDPNRATTCDAVLRDGDFVFLRAATGNAWVAVRGGRLVVAAEQPRDRAACTAPREHCYTDRYGGLLCVNYLACADERAR